MTAESWCWAVVLTVAMTTLLNVRDVIEMRRMRKRVEGIADDYQQMRLDLEAAERARKELAK